jgi:hypothetical protein
MAARDSRSLRVWKAGFQPVWCALIVHPLAHEYGTLQTRWAAAGPIIAMTTYHALLKGHCEPSPEWTRCGGRTHRQRLGVPAPHVGDLRRFARVRTKIVWDAERMEKASFTPRRQTMSL